MKTLLVTVALAATIISTQASAQDGGGWMQQDMTRQQAQQMADTLFQLLEHFEIDKAAPTDAVDVRAALAECAA